MFKDAGCFDLPEWRALHASDPESHVFASPQWQRAWWDEFAAGKELFCLRVRSAGTPVAIIPLYRTTQQGRRTLRFVGGVELTDYLGPICAAKDRAMTARALVDWLAAEVDEWDELEALNLPAALGFAQHLAEEATRQGLDLTLEQEDVSGVLDLPRDWDAYLENLPSKERHELRRKLRRLGREAADASFRMASPESLQADLKIFFEMHRGAEGHKGHFMKPEIATFFTRIAEIFMPAGVLRLDFLTVGNREAAATFSLKYGTTLYLYNSAYDGDLKRLSPGLALVAHLVSQAIADGLDRFDLLRGPERYKFQLGATAVPLNAVRISSRRAG